MLPVQPLALLRLPVTVAALAVLAALFLFPGTAYAAEPVFNTGLSSTVSVPENTAAETDIGAPYTATDGDSDILTYSLSGTDMSSFSIDSTTGQLKTSAALDFEDTTSYSVTVGVSDSKNSMDISDTVVDAMMNVAITVTNEDEAGTVTITGTLEGGVELTAEVTDLDGTVTGTTWQWSQGETADGTFTNIGSATRDKYTSIAANVGKFLRATATYKDPQSTTQDKSAEAVTGSAIAASNSEPEFPSSETGTRSVDENTAANMNIGTAVAATDTDSGATLTYALSGTAASSFNFDTGTGQIKTKDALDHETEDSYSVTLTVHDGLDAAGNTDTTGDDDITVTITVNDVNEAPTIDTGPSSFNKNENTEITEVIASYVASDVDADDNPGNLTWTLEGEDAGDFAIAKNSGSNAAELKFMVEPDYEMPADDDDNDGNVPDNVYDVTVKVSDGSLSAMKDVTITVNDVNEPPDIDQADPQSESFAEIEYDATSPDLSVATYSATDPDAGAVLSWSVSGTDASHFPSAAVASSPSP